MNDGMPLTILLNRVDGSDRLEGFDDNNCHIGTGYVKAARAVYDIGRECKKQIEGGRDIAQVDADKEGNHALAAAFYATCGYWQLGCGWSREYGQEVSKEKLDNLKRQVEGDSLGYPWSDDTLCIETTSRANLVKAAALLIAEIERIDREESCND